MENTKEILFDLLEQYEDYEDIINSLRSLNSEKFISNEDYDYIIVNYEALLKEFETNKECDK